MVLNEQKYGKKNKLYYHGSAVENLEELLPQDRWDSNHRILYISSDPYYVYKSFVEARTEGFLYICKLIRQLNIFNGNSIVDMFKLEASLDKSGFKLFENEKRDIRLNDWKIFDSYTFLKKSNIVDKVFQLQFDGFYNREDARHEGIGLFKGSDVEIIDCLTENEAKSTLSKLKEKIETQQSVQRFTDWWTMRKQI